MEDIKKPENDDQFTMILELAEADPLYEKKKKILEDTGFSPVASVSLNSSTNHDQLKDFLNSLLQQARIINSNEVELYFSGDVSNMTECCSPQNELEALNSILQVLDKSVSGDRIKHKQQNLRDEIIDRIYKVGSSFCEETKIVEGSRSDKEKSLSNWGISNGVKTKLDIAYVEGAGRGAIAKEDLKIGDIALEIPLSVIISGNLLHESDMFPILQRMDGISEETMLLLWSMKERHNDNSKFKLYFDTLPENFNTGLNFGINAVMALDGTLLLEEIVQAKEHLRSQFSELFPALSEHSPDVFPPELYTWEKFLWACELWYSNSMKIKFSDGKLRTCLIPIAGFLNHSTCPHIIQYGKVETTTSSLRFPISRPCRSGEQCFLSYGKFSSSHLLTFYGFVPRGNNPFDVIPLDIDTALDEDSMDGSPAPEWSSHMVRGTWLSKNHEIFHYGLPTPLLDHLRRARNSAWQQSSILERLETDIDVLRDLSSTFEAMMEALGGDELEEGANWDVKLAMEFKIQQMRIVSSILTSCKSGCELLESELYKHNTM